MPDILDKRLIFVTGKGGVGKSTVAAALGLVAARRGMRTVIAEVAGQDRVLRALTAREDIDPFCEYELADRLFGISIDPEHALQEYLQLQLRVRQLADLLTSSRMFQYFAAATPGLQEMVTMGKVWELAQLERRSRNATRYDLVIVDAPATGHGVAFMRTPKTFADIARVGPIAHQGRIIHSLIVDRRRTGVIAVALPEEMPVNETMLLRDEIARHLGLELDAVVVNGLYPDRFGPRQAGSLARALETAGTPLARAALQTALSEHVRARAQRDEVARLSEGIGLDPVELPFLFEPELRIDEVGRLSETLEAGL